MKKKLYRVEFSGDLFILAESEDRAEELACNCAGSEDYIGVEASEVTRLSAVSAAASARIVWRSGKSVAEVIAEADK